MNKITTLTTIALIVFGVFSAFIISGAAMSILPVVGIASEAITFSILFGVGLLYSGFIFMWNAVKRFRDQSKSKWFPFIGAATIFLTEAGVLVSHSIEVSGTDGSKFAFIGIGLMVGRLLMEISLADTIEQTEADKSGQKREDKIRAERAAYRLEALKIKEQYKRTPDTTGQKRTLKQVQRTATGKVQERREKIKEVLKSSPKIPQSELADKIGVSVRQLRRDLKHLNGSAV